MSSYQLAKVLEQKPSFESRPEDGDDTRSARFWQMAEFDGGHTWIGKWQGESPWERHSAGDEFLHVLEGSVNVRILKESGVETHSVSAGSIFVVPKNHWHQQQADEEVTVLGATPGVTDHSASLPEFS